MVLEKLDNDISQEELEEADPFEEGDLGLFRRRPAGAVLGVILDESDLYADEQLGRIAREMGFADELSAVLDRSRAVRTDEDLIRAALEAANAAGPRDVADRAVVVAADGTELARAANKREELGDQPRTPRFSRCGLPPLHWAMDGGWKAPRSRSRSNRARCARARW